VEVPSDKPIETEQLKEEFAKFDLDAENIVMSGDNNDVAVVRFLGVLPKEEIAELKAHFNEVYGSDPNISTVSPMVGKELAKNAMKAVAIASIGIILYVTFRFEWRMALAAIVALLHDVFFIIVLFSFTRLEVDLTFIAAVLTIVGYSINDTIVTFDRMRENLAKKKRIKAYEELADVVNSSLRQTLGRSVNTVLTVVIAVVALLIFGSPSILNFSLALLIGLAVGAYSSIFVAAQLWLVWKAKELKQKGVLITEKVKRERTDEPQV
jgi:SecD/SecF fusion protein